MYSAYAITSAIRAPSTSSPKNHMIAIHGRFYVLRMVDCDDFCNVTIDILVGIMQTSTIDILGGCCGIEFSEKWDGERRKVKCNNWK